MLPDLAILLAKFQATVVPAPEKLVLATELNNIFIYVALLRLTIKTILKYSAQKGRRAALKDKKLKKKID